VLRRFFQYAAFAFMWLCVLFWCIAGVYCSSALQSVAGVYRTGVLRRFFRYAAFAFMRHGVVQ